MQIYAGSFFAIPLVRWFSVKRKNDQIENRNKARLQFARALESPDIALRRKVGTSVVYKSREICILVTVPNSNFLLIALLIIINASPKHALSS